MWCGEYDITPEERHRMSFNKRMKKAKHLHQRLSDFVKDINKDFSGKERSQLLDAVLGTNTTHTPIK